MTWLIFVHICQLKNGLPFRQNPSHCSGSFCSSYFVAMELSCLRETIPVNRDVWNLWKKLSEFFFFWYMFYSFTFHIYVCSTFWCNFYIRYGLLYKVSVLFSPALGEQLFQYCLLKRQRLLLYWFWTVIQINWAYWGGSLFSSFLCV